MMAKSMVICRRTFGVLLSCTWLLLVLTACGSDDEDPIKIGYVTPKTGALAAFGEADGFVIETMTEYFKGGLEVGGSKRPVKIIVEDSASDTATAAAVADKLINDDHVHLILVSSTPETTNPVSDRCEATGTPCISTVAPWQPWFFRKADAAEKGYTWTYHYFWGLEDIIDVFQAMWDSQTTNKVVGGLWPNDGDGLAWSDAMLGYPPALKAAGYTVVDPGRYENLKTDFSAEIKAFKDAGVQIVTGVMLPPDLGTFLSQAHAQGFHPKAFTVGKAALFPAVVEALPNNLGEGLTTEIWWSPTHPFKSSLTNQSAGDLASAYVRATSRQWTQPLGFAHSLFEVAADVLKRSVDVETPEDIVAAIKATDLDTIVGHISWANGPFPNVAKTPLVGGQWGSGDLKVRTNTLAPEIPASGSIHDKNWP